MQLVLSWPAAVYPSHLPGLSRQRARHRDLVVVLAAPHLFDTALWLRVRAAEANRSVSSWLADTVREA
jgi:hypothetical protein